MSDYTSNMTSVAALDNSVFTEMSQAFLIAAHQNGTMDQFVTFKQDIGAKAIEMPKYALLSDATTPLTDKEDVASVAMSDSQVILTPVEYGNVVTKTKLVTAQSGGKADIAASQLVGINMSRTLNKLAIQAAEAQTGNILFPGSVGAIGDLIDTSVMTVTFLNQLYNKLSRSGVAPLSEGMFVAVMHPDQIHDLRNSTGAGSWSDINKYARPETVLRGEVGMLAGFRIIEDAQISIVADAGSGAVDTYSCLALGYNALGKAVSLAPQLVYRDAGDKLGRFQNLGWYTILKYGILDSDALWLGKTASSVGANT